eukprot:scaffold86846_cov32-Tisochrysis_lutea.AAC.1
MADGTSAGQFVGGDGSERTRACTTEESTTDGARVSPSEQEALLGSRKRARKWGIFPIRHVAAPMVGGSDLAFRLLCRRYGVDVAFTEMLFAERIVHDEGYLRSRLQTCSADRPLVVQLAANDPDTFVAAARLVAPMADAVDLNLGCPLPAAAAAPFGAWLLDRRHWSRLGSMISAATKTVALPIWCKIRMLPELNDTIDLCRMLESHGCSVITVHARQRPADPRASTRDSVVAADLDAVRAIVRALAIPVISNGNTQRYSDVAKNLLRTGAVGVACAEGLLRNPALFAQEMSGLDGSLERRELGRLVIEYLRLAKKYPPPDVSWIRGHVMWMLGKEGKGHRCRFPEEYLGPFTSAQLLCAIQMAETISDFEALIRATLLVQE